VTTYKNQHYISSERVYAFLEQFKHCPKNSRVLEVGSGSKISSELLRPISSEYKTIDIDEDLNPDILGDITDSSIFNQLKGQFDTVYCCQVLEHIPLDSSLKAIDNLLLLNASKVIISIPDNRKYFKFSLRIPKFNFTKVLSIPYSGKKVTIENHQEHHWEIGSISTSTFINKFKSNKNYRLVNEYRLYERPYQHFFILEKI